LQYLQRIHEAVLTIANAGYSPESEDFWQLVMAELSLSPAAANPIVCRSFAAHSKVLNQQDLLHDEEKGIRRYPLFSQIGDKTEEGR
jgi:hypothetical protein